MDTNTFRIEIFENEESYTHNLIGLFAGDGDGDGECLIMENLPIEASVRDALDVAQMMAANLEPAPDIEISMWDTCVVNRLIGKVRNTHD